MTGWDAHGHAVKTGLPIDEHLGVGELQDSEDCGCSPIYVLSRIGVDRSYGVPAAQYRLGRIHLTDGTVLERGGTLGCVWAVVRLPKPACTCPTPTAGVIDVNRGHLLGCPRLQWLAAGPTPRSSGRADLEDRP